MAILMAFAAFGSIGFDGSLVAWRASCGVHAILPLRALTVPLAGDAVAGIIALKTAIALSRLAY
jgi:hypothetical protein